MENLLWANSRWGSKLLAMAIACLAQLGRGSVPLGDRQLAENSCGHIQAWSDHSVSAVYTDTRCVEGCHW